MEEEVLATISDPEVAKPSSCDMPSSIGATLCTKCQHVFLKLYEVPTVLDNRGCGQSITFNYHSTLEHVALNANSGCALCAVYFDEMMSALGPDPYQELRLASIPIQPIEAWYNQYSEVDEPFWNLKLKSGSFTEPFQGTNITLSSTLVIFRLGKSKA